MPSENESLGLVTPRLWGLNGICYALNVNGMSSKHGIVLAPSARMAASWSSREMISQAAKSAAPARVLGPP